MFDPAQPALGALWLLTLPPLLAFLIAMITLQRAPRAAAALVILSGVLSLAGAAWLLGLGGLGHAAAEAESTIAEPAPAAAGEHPTPADGHAFLFRGEYLLSGAPAPAPVAGQPVAAPAPAEGLHLRFGFWADGLARLMALVVALVTLCVQVYSLGYMAHDPGRVRYFALLGFFAWAMLNFVLAADLMQAFIFWELVGLASFFLIGFWNEKPEATAAARKAFMMTRVGDVGLMMGLFLLVGTTGTFDMPTLLDPASGIIAAIPPGRLTLITLLILVGVLGKSAQFPLHTWLPDAMQGPTPVSALLHSATMVAAGVYLVARLLPLFSAAPATMQAILVLGTVTMLLASALAMVEPDLKRILAYSSISQLGIMLLGLAAGSLAAGVLHLTTHAFFKAQLFLCAGLFIHHCGSNDAAEIGRRGGRRLKVAVTGLVIGGLALAGVPPLSGFTSKEGVLAALTHSGRHGVAAAFLLGGAMTAYYTTRMLLLVLRPRAAAAAESASHGAHATHAGHDDHHLPASLETAMRAPVLLLAAITLLGGIALLPLAHHLAPGLPHPSAGEMVLALALLAAGAALAWVDFGRAGAPGTCFAERLPLVAPLLRERFYIDALYNATFGRAVAGLALACGFVERRAIDGGGDRTARTLMRGGRRAAGMQAGWLQLYLTSTALLAAIFLVFISLQG